jgi:dTDP-4-amino-4,6-dideoxygalactose transaminase
MNKNQITRRQFMATSTVGAVSAFTTKGISGYRTPTRNSERLAILGGSPVITKPFIRWPRWDETDESSVIPVLRSGVWSRNKMVAKAEEKFAKLMGAKHCLTTTNGTHALITSLHALGIGAGDEVITTPYTFVATIDAILLLNALPVFVDVDPQTWQIDPDKIEEKITKNTTAILPVHITGGVCDMDKIIAIGKKYNLKIIEDACEAHLAEWSGKKVGTLGDLGCFSFQTGKMLTCGEGGAILGEDEKIMDLCYAFHNFGRARGKYLPKDQGAYPILGTKCRMSEYQAAILINQMNTLVEQTNKRKANADYLNSKIKEIPGIFPRKDYPETTKTAYYYYGFRYQKDFFEGLSRDKFFSALKAEGIPVSTGLGVISKLPLNKEGVIEYALNSKTFKKIFSKKQLDEYRLKIECPECDQLCKETVGFHGKLLLGSKNDMDDIFFAIKKVYDNRKELLS